MSKKTLLRIGIVLLAVFIVVFLVYQFSPAPDLPVLSESTQLDKAVWMGVTWSMDPHTDEEVQSLAQDLLDREIDYAFVYVSYLKPGDFFNPTYDYAAEFVGRLRQFAPDLKVLAWIGVPLQVTTPEGERVSDRLQSTEIQEMVSDFSAMVIEEMSFDGVHLNIELIPDQDMSIVDTLQLVRSRLPEDAILSTTAHALAVTEPIASLPYPNQRHHWSPDYLQAVAGVVDQIAVMAYDSGLPFPAAYRSWMEYQVRNTAEALSDVDVDVLIGLPTSEEWTFSHHVISETLVNALSGLHTGLSESQVSDAIDGIAVYPYWETGEDEWQLLEDVP